MRSFLAFVFAAVAASATLACTANVGNCDLDPAADCFNGKTNAGGGGSTATTGGGGTGTGPKCVAADCPKDDCNEGVCVGDQCALEPKSADTDCGNGLKCDGMGACKCTGDNEQSCPSDQCNAPKCKGGLCTKEPTAGVACEEPAGVAGKCDAMGLCATCSDGEMNGGETGIDCGSPDCGNCDGVVCGDNVDCKSQVCVDGVCCNTACDGKCEACEGDFTGQADGVCAAISLGMNDANFSDCDAKGGCGVAGLCRCEDGVQSAGETDVDCGGSCGQICTRGQKCATKDDCAGGSECTDGVCCAAKCDGTCEICNAPDREGLCLPIQGADDADECNGASQCNLAGLCAKATGEACSSGGQCATGICKNSLCVPCDAVNTCAAIYKCFDGYCAAAAAQGEACTDNAMCTSNFCVDGVCCENACGGTCMACHNNYTGQSSGLCAPMLSTYDPHDECQGAGKAATCSGAPADGNDASSCGAN